MSAGTMIYKRSTVRYLPFLNGLASKLTEDLLPSAAILR